MFPEPESHSASALRVGLEASFERDVVAEDILAFARNSGDANPLHIDAAYAASTTFGRPVAHGAFQVGLASALIGMHLPGRQVLLGSISARFPSPLYYPCRVRVRGEITSWNPASLSGTLRVTVQDVASGLPTAEILLGFTLHQQKIESTRSSHEPVRQPVQAVDGAERPIVLITGASGGIGAALAGGLSRDYLVLAMVNRNSLPEALKQSPQVVELRANLAADAEWEEIARAALGGAPLYGIVHAAWPGAPHGGLLGAADDLIKHQLEFGTTHLIRLARFLFANAPKEGGRLVALGSIAGGTKPVIALGAYSLGKASLEHSVRLLAPELARKKITVNALCPSFVPTGMNKQANDRQILRETAFIPMGRVCLPDDIAGAVRYLLAPEASFVSGQIIGLAGAQL